MRHRIGGLPTGLGNTNKELLNGAFTQNKELDALIIEMCEEAVPLFFKKFGFCEAQYSGDSILIGCEPSYMHQGLKIIELNAFRPFSSITEGYSFGAYGTGIVKTKKYEGEYKYNSKFVKFIGKWHEKFIKGGYLK